MDTGNGNFVKVEGNPETDNTGLKDRVSKAQAKYPNHGGLFYVGQNLEFEGSKFRVIAITKKTITLRVLAVTPSRPLPPPSDEGGVDHARNGR